MIYKGTEKIVHWTALYIGSLLALMTIVFFIGEGILGETPIHMAGLVTIEKMMFVALGLMLVGVAAAWWSPAYGGAVVVIGSLVFMAANSAGRGHFDAGGFYPVLYAIVGILLLLDAYLRREMQVPSQA